MREYSRLNCDALLYPALKYELSAVCGQPGSGSLSHDCRLRSDKRQKNRIEYLGYYGSRN
jgi:hypothetical protein